MLRRAAVSISNGRIGAFLDVIEPKRLPPGGPDPAPTQGEKGSPYEEEGDEGGVHEKARGRTVRWGTEGERRLDPVDATWEKDMDRARGKRRIGTSKVPSP